LITIFEPALTFIKNAEIFDASGKLISKLAINQSISSFSMPVGGLLTGNYILKINYTNESVSHKFIKK
jgi:hypothetical protein